MTEAREKKVWSSITVNCDNCTYQDCTLTGYDGGLMLGTQLPHPVGFLPFRTLSMMALSLLLPQRR